MAPAREGNRHRACGGTGHQGRAVAGDGAAGSDLAMTDSTIPTALLWAIPIALGLWAMLLLASGVARRNRRGVAGVAPGMPVYDADRQVLGYVDRVQENGLLVGGHFIPEHAVGRVTAQGVVLNRPGSRFSRGALRGDRPASGVDPLESDEATAGIRFSATPARVEVPVYQDVPRRRR